jgi:hypothetical protein
LGLIFKNETFKPGLMFRINIGYDFQKYKPKLKFQRPGSLECAEAPLVRWQASFSISRGGIDLVRTKVIVLAVYLGSSRLLALIIACRILQDECPFLLGFKSTSLLSSP